MGGFDYDVVVIGSGFGGSVAALRAAENGYRVGVMESGRRWKDEDIPKTQWDLPHFWLPAAEMYGVQRIEYLDDVLISPALHCVLAPYRWRELGVILSSNCSARRHLA
jgi:cholesterol oxidase